MSLFVLLNVSVIDFCGFGGTKDIANSKNFVIITLYNLGDLEYQKGFTKILQYCLYTNNKSYIYIQIHAYSINNGTIKNRYYPTRPSTTCFCFLFIVTSSDNQIFPRLYSCCAMVAIVAIVGSVYAAAMNSGLEFYNFIIV